MDKDKFIKVIELIDQLETAKLASRRKDFPFAMVTYDGLTMTCEVFDWFGDESRTDTYVHRVNGLHTETEKEFTDVIPVLEEKIRQVNSHGCE